MQRVENHMWSGFNIPIFWAAAGTDSDPVLLNWMANMITHFVEKFSGFDEMVTGTTVQESFNGIRRGMRQLGINNKL